MTTIRDTEGNVFPTGSCYLVLSSYQVSCLFVTGRSNCYDRGMCDYCHETCLCYEGQGNKTADIVDGGGWVRLDCAHCECIL